MEMMPATQDERLRGAFQQLSDFDAGRWASWIDAYVTDKPLPPYISRGDEAWHAALNAIYDQLPGHARDAFRSGLTRCFRTTPPEPDALSRRKLFTFLEVVAHSTPLDILDFLKQRLSGGSFTPLVYADRNLGLLLMITISQFGVDRDLIRHI